MHFELTDDQVALQDAIRRVCTEVFPSDRIRATESTGGVDRAGWNQLAEMGVFALRLPEADGGAGLGMPDAAIVFEELGRACVPGPTIATHLAATHLDGAADGERVVGMVEVLGDVPAVVEHLAALDALVVVRDDGLELVAPSELDARPIERSLDPLTPLHAVDVLPAGERIGDAAAARAWRREGALLTAAFQVGLATTVLDLAVEHAKTREQFLRPIGSFQGVKHPLADSFVRAELARVATHAAAVMLDDANADPQDVDRAISSAKLLAGEAALENAKTSVQMHGAMGFTWELDVHLYLKRAWVLDSHYGSLHEHAAAIAASL